MIVLARPRARMLPAAIIALAFLTFPIAGCNVLSAFQEEEVTTQENTEELKGTLGYCKPWFDRGVVDVALSVDGSRIAYVATRRPESFPEDGWRSGHRAVFIRDGATSAAPTTRYVATTWPAVDRIPTYSTDDPSRQGRDDSIGLDEQIEAVALSADGTRIVIGASRDGIRGGLAKLYLGSVPENTTSTLSPDDGLTIVPINLVQSGEAVADFELSPDGTKIAASVGARGELRVYDLVANQPIVYTLGEKNEVLVEDVLPEAGTSIDVDRRPAILTGGNALHWSPDGTKLAFARSIPVSRSFVQSLDVATGDLTTVASMLGVTTPSLAWASDGGSLFVMTTDYADSQAFGDTEIRRFAAEDDGEEIGGAVTLERKAWWRGEPNNLVGFGNDRQFLYILNGELVRIDLPIDDAGAPKSLALKFDKGTVSSQQVFVSAAADRAVFLVNSSGTTHVGQVTYVGQYPCPEAPTGAPTGSGDDAAAPAEDAPAATEEG